MQYLALPIPDCPEYYASLDGDIISRKNGGAKNLSPKTDKGGYLEVGIRPHGAHVMRKVHRLVLQTFRGAPGPNEEARHLDGNPANNHLFNLTWGTKAENEEDKRRHGTHMAQLKAKLTPDQVKHVMLSDESGAALAKLYGVTRTAIAQIRQGKTYRHITGGKNTSRQWRGRLTAEQIEYIRASNLPQSALAKEFGVCQQLISNIRRGKIYIRNNEVLPDMQTGNSGQPQP